MIKLSFDLNSFLKKFHASMLAGLVTNIHGFILEANTAAVDMFKAGNISAMKSKNIVTYAHRKFTNDLRQLVSGMKNHNVVDVNHIQMRPRGSDSFLAEIKGEVLYRDKLITLIDWEVIDSTQKFIRKVG